MRIAFLCVVFLALASPAFGQMDLGGGCDWEENGASRGIEVGAAPVLIPAPDTDYLVVVPLCLTNIHESVSAIEITCGAGGDEGPENSELYAEQTLSIPLWRGNDHRSSIDDVELIEINADGQFYRTAPTWVDCSMRFVVSGNEESQRPYSSGENWPSACSSPSGEAEALCPAQDAVVRTTLRQEFEPD